MSTISDVAQDIPLTRSQRLDRLPFGPLHRKLVLGAGIGWALDAMDVGLISFLLVAIKEEWHLGANDLSWIATMGFIGMAVGAAASGLLADRIGRRNVFVVTLVIYGLATGLSAISSGLLMFLVFRLVVGLGLGGELPVASTLVSEYAPARIRGRIIVALESFWAIGWLLAACLGKWLVPVENGWRWALVIGVVPAVYALYVRRNLPESVRFLERRGQTGQAEDAVREFERASGVAPVPSPDRVAAEPPRLPLAQLWQRPYAGRTLALWVTWFGVNFAYYGAFLWIPTFLVESGFPMAKSFSFTLWITLAQLPGYALSAVLVEKLGRRATLAAFLAGSAVAALLFGHATSDAAILATGCALSFCNLGAWGALYAVTPEVYPTLVRATGAGSATAFGRIASIVAPLIVPRLFHAHGEGPTFAVIAVSFAVATLAALALPERRGAALEV